MIVSKDRKLNNFCNKCSNNNSGFTLVELVVVLALMAILFGTVIAGGLGWQDWARFNHEETVAEDLFFVAQNQLTELDSSGALTNKVVRPLMSGNNYNPDYVLATAKNNTALTKIAYSSESGGSKKYYVWNEIWDTYLTNNNVNSQRATIIRLMANNGDYDLYMQKRNNPSSGSEPVGKGAELLFDLIAPYVTDTSVLNGSIVLEFSPEAGQVFSVCYSDRADSFIYANSNSGNNVQINDRRIQIRRDNMVGYYSSDKLYEKLKGIIENETDLRLEIKNDMLLEMIVSLRNPSSNSLKNGDTLEFEIFDGKNSVDPSVMSFSLEYDSTAFPTDLSAASKNPTTVSISFADTAGAYAGQEDVEFRLPVYLSSDRKLHIILDAADVQAGTYVYNRALLDSSNTDGKHADYEDRFKNTYSFYRFGLLTGEASDVHYIYGKLTHKDSSGVADEGTYSERYIGESGENPDGYVEHTDDSCRNDNGFYGECTTFASFTPNGSNSIRTLEIDNPRHFYNIRYESDYKKNTGISNTFKLISNIDWNDMIGKGESDVNYFLNSYDASVSAYKAHSGIDYDGLNPATESLTADDHTDTSVYPFPGFRCLDKKDIFTQEYSEADTYADDGSSNGLNSYHINNLRISIAANIIYGVYDCVFFDPSITGSVASDYSDAKNRALNSFDFTGTNTIARKGQLPLGLFAENLGTISNITLDKHVVEGMQVLGNNKNIVYTCMSGGFAGNNIGTISGLTILDSAADNDTINRKTHINGRTDVGGIIGRQSFSVNEADEVTLAELCNEGTVTGYENVGGIVGRAYVHYTGDDAANGTPSPDSYGTIRKEYYKDGYSVSETGKSLAMSKVYRAKSISIEDCINKGHVTGDPLIYDEASHNQLDGVNVSNDKFIHCAFIGGIAGLTMDGFPIDDDINAIQNYMSNGFYSGTYTLIKVSNCKSEVFYTKSEIEDMRNSDFAGVNNMKDCYVGGLIGYARLTYIIDCGNGDDDETDFTSNDKIPLVMGGNYVGGLIGCSDESKYGSDKGRTYNSVNNNLVIGYRFVGGIAGGFGVGGVHETGNYSTFSFKNPAQNDASQPSVLSSKYSDVSVDPNKTSRKYLATKLCNKGIVLGLKNDKDLNAIFEKSSDTQAGIKNTKAGSSMIGGIAGASHTPLDGCDNIQSDNTKKYNLSLIGFTSADISGFDNLTTEYITGVVNKSAFGGSLVGGIEGCVLKFGYINRLAINQKKPNSNINAIVFGQDYVGGGVGMISDEGYTNAFNFYPSTKNNPSKVLDGMVVIGRDSVGGIAGVIRAKFNFDKENRNTDAISRPYVVYGRYGVGGFTGTIYTSSGASIGSGIAVNLKMSGTDRVSVNGIAYVGGIAGVDLDWKPHVAPANGNVVFSGVDINGKYFAGGYFGAYDNSQKELDWTNVKTPLSNNTVNADIFGGGIAGLYSVGISSRKPFNSLDSSGNADGTLFNLAESLWDSTNKKYVDAKTAFNRIVNRDTNNEVVFLTNTNTFTFNFTLVNTTPVTAKLFAGGFFGYIPEGTKLTITSFTNDAKIKTTGYVGVGSGVSSNDALNPSDKYSYLGGVIGRVPKGTVLDNCANTSTDYSSEYATYLGGLTEVNAGTIQNCINKTDFKYDDIYVGALAGINAGEAEISDCVNLGSIKGEKAAGIVAGSSGSDVVILCRNYGKIEGASGSYGIAAGAVGNITKNLEASGLGLSVNEDDPVAPLKSKEPLDFTNLVRNFYIYGNVKQADLDNGSGNQSTGDIYFSSNDNNLKPALSKPSATEVTHDEEAGTYTLNVDETGFKKIRLTNDSDETRKYVNNIQIASPSGGLDMDFFRIYWLRLYSQYGFKYTVSFTYLDDNNEEQRVYYDRAINKMANFDDTAEPDTDIGYHNQDVLCYDEISIRDNNGNRIKPVKIQIYAEYQESVGNEEFWYSAFTWGKYTDTGRNEYMIVDEANKVSTSDMTSAALDTASIDAAYISCNHDTANEKVRYSTIDRWSKQLVILEGTDGKYNLVYKRYGMYKRDNDGALVKLMTNSVSGPTFENKTPQQKYDAYDDWFIQTFAEDVTNYPNSDFVN